jgi:hypothetical protein
VRSCSDTVTSASVRTIERLRRLFIDCVSIALVRRVHIHIGYLAELAWSANEVFPDLVGQLDYRQKVANTEPEAHYDVRPSTSDVDRDIRCCRQPS